MAKKKKEKDSAVVDRWLEADLSELANTGKLDPGFGVEALVDRVTEALIAGRSPLVVGESGVGKTVVIHELLKRAREDARHPLHGQRVLQLSIRRCSSTTNRNESIGAVMIELGRWLHANPEVTPYFRDFHLAWRHDLEPHFDALSRFLRRPILCEGDREEVDLMFDYEPSLQESFVPIVVTEPDLRRTREILAAWARNQEGVSFTPGALETGLQLSHRFLARGKMPRKCLEPLSKLVEMARAGNRTTPISEEEITLQFCKAHTVPRLLVDQQVTMDLDGLRERFEERILGQAEAVDAMMNMIGRVKAGLIDPRRPFGVFLFVGPTGVGKTHIARMMADELFGSADRMVRLNMADYPQDEHADLVFGDPRARSVNQQRGVLTQRIMGHPLAILLLDEFEKASAKIHDRLLQLFDEGVFLNGKGESISCRSLVIIATSNAGAELWRESSTGFGAKPIDPALGLSEDVTRQLDERLAKQFRFEFLNRFDQVVHFRPLTREGIRTLALRELQNIESRAGLRLRGVTLEVDEAVIDWLTVHGYDPFFGARFLQRTIERNVSSAIADLLLREAGGEASERIELVVRKNAVHARWFQEPVVQTPAEPSERRAESLASLGDDEFAEVVRQVRAEAQARLALLEDLRQEYSNVLESMNSPGFWDGPERGGGVLERFRELDVTIRAQERLVTPLERILDADGDRKGVSALLGDARSALERWEAQATAGFSQTAWLVARVVDPNVPIDGWLEEFCGLERAWARRRRLELQVAGYSLLHGEVAGAVLEATGPDVIRELGMEVGVHRLSRREARDLRVRVDVLPSSESPSATRSLRPADRVPARLGLTPRVVGKLKVSELGIAEDWFGGDSDALAAFLEGYEAHLLDRRGETAETARIYGENGIGARDPRTKATIPRYKDAMRGKLDKLARAWGQAQI